MCEPELSDHVCPKMLIRMPFRSSNEVVPKCSIRVVPTSGLQWPCIGSNESDYCVSSYLIILGPDTYAISELQRERTEVLNKGGANFWAPI